jgi:hypothetical protein
MRSETKETVRECIISILSEEFPLSTNQLKNEINKKNGKTITYQAVHKELNTLLEEKAIKKEDKTFSLNLEWIQKKHLFFKKTYINYTKLKKYSLGLLKRVREDGMPISLEFNSISEMDEYFVHVMEYFQEITPKNIEIVMIYRHNWWPLLYGKREETVIDQTNKRFYCLCTSDTPLDQWATKYENKIGMNVKISSKRFDTWNVHVYGDIIIQFNIDPAITTEIDKYFDETKKIEQVNHTKLHQILDRNSTHTVLVYKDKKLSSKIRNETIAIIENEI